MADRRLTDVELERLLAGDYPAARAAELEAKATDADRARREELKTEHAAFLGTVDVDAEVRAIGKRMAKMEPDAKPAASWWRWVFTGGALAAAAAAVIFFVGRRDSGTDGDDIGFKGGDVTLVVHAANDTGSRTLASGDTIAPGTRIRFEVGSAKRGYVTVIGFDAGGATTVYYPYGGAEAAVYDPKTGGLLPGAIAVDATPGAEKYYAVFSEHPFSVESVAAGVQGKGAFPQGVSHAEVVLEKRSP
ncbi:MAG: DUF4384 domain-containing protein [Kofleriaceae bacterium]